MSFRIFCILPVSASHTIFTLQGTRLLNDWHSDCPHLKIIRGDYSKPQVEQYWRSIIHTESPPSFAQLRKLLSRHTAAPAPSTLMANPDFDTPISAPPMPLRRAAVLIAIISAPDNTSSEPHILLTLRNPDLPKHPGQVALPGGTQDSEDANTLQTALRESHEETNLAPESISHPCQLPDFISSSGFRITPYVGIADNISVADLKADPAEVSDLFTIPLVTCLNAEAYHLSRINHNGLLRAYFEISGTKHRLWGVTAGILRGFRSWLLTSAEASSTGQ